MAVVFATLHVNSKAIFEQYPGMQYQKKVANGKSARLVSRARNKMTLMISKTNECYPMDKCDFQIKECTAIRVSYMQMIDAI
jgi:hypothetical protein